MWEVHVNIFIQSLLIPFTSDHIKLIRSIFYIFSECNNRTRWKHYQSLIQTVKYEACVFSPVCKVNADSLFCAISVRRSWWMMLVTRHLVDWPVSILELFILSRSGATQWASMAPERPASGVTGVTRQQRPPPAVVRAQNTSVHWVKIGEISKNL